MSIYSQAKPLYHIDRIEALRQGEAPPPVHVQMILSDLCNQDCSFCAYRMSAGLSREMFVTPETHNPNRRMPTDKAIEIVEDCFEMGVRAIQFTGGGEPTVHKDWQTIIHTAQKMGMETALVTNGTRISSQSALQRLSWLRVSVDAGTAETYARVRRVRERTFEDVWENISTARMHTGGVLGVGFVITPDNFREMTLCAIRAREAGADNIRLGAVFSKEGLSFYDSVNINEVLDELDRAKEVETDDFQVLDLFGRRFSDLEGGSPEHKFCGYQYFTQYIGADLNVYRCCNTAYTPKGLLGSLKDQRYRDFKPNWPLDARTCQFCQFQGQNEAINSVLQAPEHPDFV